METEAIETRSKTLRDKASSQVLYLPHDEEHDQRQAFRKRVNYIIGATKRVQAVESLKVCIPDSPRRAEAVVDLVGVVGCFGACAHRILQNPEEKKARRFKITNPKVQRTIMVPKGVCELVVEVSFKVTHESKEFPLPDDSLSAGFSREGEVVVFAHNTQYAQCARPFCTRLRITLAATYTLGRPTMPFA